MTSEKDNIKHEVMILANMLDGVPLGKAKRILDEVWDEVLRRKGSLTAAEGGNLLPPRPNFGQRRTAGLSRM